MLHAPFEAAAPGAKPPPEHHVYVIDDEASLRDSSCFLLATLGLACTQYANGQDFLADVETLEPGCILLDVLMRRMGGLEVQAELNRRGIDWPIIFMSGHDDIPTVVRAMKNGAVEFLEKPFSDEQLLASLHRGFVKLRNGHRSA
ncbi:MAG TPA: response regulator [Allosphingosinicella sp.]|nr:response regulator [Allosphingosinicella sp.]